MKKKKSRKGKDDEKDREKDAEEKKKKSRKGKDAKEDKGKDAEKTDRKDKTTKEETTTKRKKRKRGHEKEEHDEEEEEKAQNTGVPKVARRASTKTRVKQLRFTAGKATSAKKAGKKASAKPAADEKEASANPGAEGNSCPTKRPAAKIRGKRRKTAKGVLGANVELPAAGVLDAIVELPAAAVEPHGPPTIDDPDMDDLSLGNSDSDACTPPRAGLLGSKGY